MSIKLRYDVQKSGVDELWLCKVTEDHHGEERYAPVYRLHPQYDPWELQEAIRAGRVSIQQLAEDVAREAYHAALQVAYAHPRLEPPERNDEAAIRVLAVVIQRVYEEGKLSYKQFVEGEDCSESARSPESHRNASK